MGYVNAVLIKRRTDDNLVGVPDRVPLGQIYIVDTRTVRRLKLFTMHGIAHEKEVVNLRCGGWFPTELLNILDCVA